MTQCVKDTTKTCPASPDYRLNGQVIAKVADAAFLQCCKVQEQIAASKRLSDKLTKEGKIFKV